MAANCTATAWPAGPVAPRTPIFTGADLHAPGRSVDSPLRVPAMTHPVPPPSLEGSAPDGDPVRVDVSTGRRVLWFLTSSCKPCRQVWPVLGAGDVAVTPSP